jgi:hypothetical protein
MNPIKKILGHDVGRNRVYADDTFFCDKCNKTVRSTLNYGTGWNLCDDCTNSKDVNEWSIKQSKRTGFKTAKDPMGNIIWRG